MALLRRKSREYMSVRMGNPRARLIDDLVVEELEDEVLVYDGKNHQAHCLASAAAKVWRACDGTKDVPALAESLALSLDDVTRALEMLDGVELLENQGLADRHQRQRQRQRADPSRARPQVGKGRRGRCRGPDALFDRRTVRRRCDADEPGVRALLHR